MSYFGIIDGIPSENVASIRGLRMFHKWVEVSGSSMKFGKDDELSRLADDGMTKLPAVCAEQLVQMVKLSPPDESTIEVARKIHAQLSQCESVYGIADNASGPMPDDDQMDPQEYIDSQKAAKLADESTFTRIFKKLTGIRR